MLIYQTLCSPQSGSISKNVLQCCILSVAISGLEKSEVWVLCLSLNILQNHLFFCDLESSGKGWVPVFNELFFRERLVNGERNVFIILLCSLWPQEMLVLHNMLHSFIVLRKFTATRIYFL